jgi:hypothetical protein
LWLLLRPPANAEISGRIKIDLWLKSDREIVAAFTALLQVIDQQAKRITKLEQRVTGIERQLGQNSSNSSTPPSSDGFRKSNNHFVCPVEKMELLPKAALGKHAAVIPASSWNFSRYFVRTWSFRMISWKNSRYFHAVPLHCRIRVKLAGGFPVSYSIF